MLKFWSKVTEFELDATEFEFNLVRNRKNHNLESTKR